MDPYRKLFTLRHIRSVLAGLGEELAELNDDYLQTVVAVELRPHPYGLPESLVDIIDDYIVALETELGVQEESYAI